MSGQVSVKIKRERFQQLVNGSIVTGISVEAMVDEALEQFIECNLATLIESRASQTASA